MNSVLTPEPTLMVYTWFSDDPWHDWFKWFKPITIPPMPSTEKINITMEELRRESLLLESRYGRSMGE